MDSRELLHPLPNLTGVETRRIGPPVAPKLIEFLQAWVMRGENRRVTIKAQTGGRSIEVEYSPKSLSQAELMLDVSRRPLSTHRLANTHVASRPTFRFAILMSRNPTHRTNPATSAISSSVKPGASAKRLVECMRRHITSSPPSRMTRRNSTRLSSALGQN